MLENPDLLRLVLSSPDDDGPRLVYADWLGDQGEDERAEFITTQCEIARHEREFDKPSATLLGRETILRKGNKEIWVENVDGLVRRAFLERGFVERVWPTPNFDDLREACRRAPIRWLELGELGDEDIEQIAASGIVDEIGGARFPMLASDERLAMWFDLATSRVSRLRWLSLPESRLSTIGIERLRAVPWQRLEHLDLGRGASDPGAVGAMLASPTFASLRRLDVSTAFGHPSQSDRMALALASASSLGTLEDLALGTDLGDAGMSALCATPFRALRRLDIGKAKLTGEGFHALVAAPFLDGLRALILGDPSGIYRPRSIGQSELFSFLGSSRLTALRMLDLSGLLIEDEGAEILCGSPHLRNLRSLVLRSCDIGPAMQRTLRKRFGVGVCSFGG